MVQVRPSLMNYNKYTFIIENNYNIEYQNIFIMIIISLIMGIILLVLSFILSKKTNKNTEKLSTYECGFDPFDDSRQKFEVQFYLIGILFILFDLEIALLFPWAALCSHTTNFGIWIVFDFLFELIIGFVYALESGALDWH